MTAGRRADRHPTTSTPPPAVSTRPRPGSAPTLARRRRCSASPPDRRKAAGQAVVTGGAPVTATNVIVLRDGRVVQGTWERPSIGQVMRLIGPGGQVVPLHPGRTWVQLEPVGSSPGRAAAKRQPPGGVRAR